MAKNVIFKFGSQAKYDALETKDPFSLYWLEDTKRIYKGDELYAVGGPATGDAPGLLSPTEKLALTKIIESGVAGLSAVDNSVVVDTGEDGMTIGVRVSEAQGNTLRLEEDGLFVPTPTAVLVPEYTMERQTEATSGAAATYRLKKTTNGTAEYVGDPIDIPKDLVLESGTLETVTAPDVPYEGAQVGDLYLDLVLNDATASHIYIPVNGLVDTYTAGEGIRIVNGQISVDNRTVQALTGTNGRALIFNESDGGGAKFEHNDGTMSFVGVNDGGANGITGQIYSVKKDTVTGKNVGTRINMTTTGFYYVAGGDSAAYTADDEIATKRDISAAALAWSEM